MAAPRKPFFTLLLFSVRITDIQKVSEFLENPVQNWLAVEELGPCKEKLKK